MARKKPQLLTPEQEQQQLRQLWDDAIARITPEALARGHAHHLKIYASLATNLIFYCSRRAGKTEVCLGLLLLTAIARNGVSCLYLGLTKNPVKKVWRRWKRLLAGFGLVCVHSESDGAFETELGNGSRIAFGTTDDARHIQTLLGDSMAGGIAIVDESQSQSSILEELVVEILEPMLSEITPEHPIPGRLVIAGTAVDSAGGFFDTIYEQNADLDETGHLLGTKPESEWECFSWSRFDNPGELNNQALLDKYLKKYHLDASDPFVLQVWHGLRVFDTNATAFRYSVERNRYTAQIAPWSIGLELAPGKLLAVIPKPGIDTFACGIDAGSHDRTGIVLWGWSSRHILPGVWQVAEWSTERQTPVATSQYYAVLKEFKRRYGRIIRSIRDDGSSQTIDDSLKIETGITIEPPKKGKGSKKARVERLADLLQTDRAHILAGGALETDLMLTRWDQAKRAEGRWDFDNSIIHPDVGDAGTYGLEGTFLEAPGKAATIVHKTEIAAVVADFNAALEKRFKPQPKKEKPRDSKSLWR